MALDLLTLPATIAARKNSRAGDGIALAFDYVSTITSDESLCKAAKGVLVYRNDECKAVAGHGEAGLFGTPRQEGGIPRTPKSLLDFEAVMTSIKKDRDNDVLLPAGATLDMEMPLLWQHFPSEPIGKLVKNLLHNSEMIVNHYAVADVPLGRDAVVLVEFGALRISHGFRALEAEWVEGRGNERGGFLVSKYHVMETSLVSIPSNTDAIITAWSREKLHHPLVKGYAQTLHQKLAKTVVGGWAGDVHIHVGNPQEIEQLSKDLKAISEQRPLLTEADRASILAEVKESLAKESLAKEASTKEPAPEPEAPATPPPEPEREDGNASSVMLGSVASLLESVLKVEGLPEEAKSRIGLCGSILADIESSVSARTEEMAGYAKSKDLIGLFKTVTGMIRGCCYGLSSIADEADRCTQIEGLAEDAKQMCEEVCGCAKSIEASMLDVIKAALGIEEDGAEHTTHTDGALIGCSAEQAEKSANELIANIIGGFSVSEDARAILIPLLV